MVFLNEKGHVIDIEKMEATEQEQAEKYIDKYDKVLELGVRYGTVTYRILNKLDSTDNYVGVEPDSRVWSTINHNLKSFNNVNIVHGFISRTPLALEELDSYYGYGTTSTKNSDSTIPHFTLEEIENKYNISFNVLVADCEGFLEQFLDENEKLYKQLRMILFEEDYPNKCNYEKIKQKLRDHDFKVIENSGMHQVWKKLDTQ